MRVTVIARSMVSGIPIIDSGVFALKQFTDRTGMLPVTIFTKLPSLRNGEDARKFTRPNDLAGTLNDFEYVLNDDCTYTVTARYTPPPGSAVTRPRLHYDTIDSRDVAGHAARVIGIHI